MASKIEAIHESSSRRPSTCYAIDFEECCRLGGGGQGSVYKAIHKLDRKEYAIKKVRFKMSREKELLREVKALSNLNHENIVRYHYSWTEDGELSDEEEAESSVLSTDKCSPADSRVTEGSCSQTKEPPRILYIQMELCWSTLRQWIDQRNKDLSDTRVLVLEKEKIMDIMCQILRGVEYIHKEKLIHRDLKPENILHTESQVFKIGDFGLAKLDDVDQDATERCGRYQVGTPPYKAPETEQNTKSDMYSVGVIMLEMCYKMDTFMEKVTVTDNLRCGELPKGLKTKGWKKQAGAVKQMVCICPFERPSATDLVNGPLFLTQEQEIKILRDKVKLQRKQIENLKEILKHASLHGPATLYKPFSTRNRLVRLKKKLAMGKQSVVKLSSQLSELHAEFTTTDLHPESKAMFYSMLSQRGTGFQTQTEQDCFFGLCLGLALLYRRFHRDVMNLIAHQILTLGLNRLGGQAGLQELLMGCIQVVSDWERKQECLAGELKMREMLFSCPAASKQRMRRKRRGKFEEAGASATIASPEK